MSTPKQVYEGPDPSELIAHIWKDHGPNAVISEPQLVRKGGVLGFFATSQYRLEVKANPTASTNPGPSQSTKVATEAAPQKRSVGTKAALESLIEQTQDAIEFSVVEKKSFDTVLNEVAGSLGDDPAMIKVPAFAGAATKGTVKQESSIVELARSALASPKSPPKSAPSPRRTDARSPASVVLAPEDFSLNADLRTLLEEVGLAEQFIERLRGAEIDTPGEAFSRLFPLPTLPRWPGSLIAIVGPETDALSHARAIATSLRLEAEDVAVARRPAQTQQGARQQPARAARRGGSSVSPAATISDAKQAAIRSGELRRDRIGIVAVSHLSNTASDRWTRAILYALRPTVTWMVVDARNRQSEIVRIAQAIGGVDALIAENAASCYWPCEILSAGFPVARLDGTAASAARWSRVVQKARERQEKGQHK